MPARRRTLSMCTSVACASGSPAFMLPKRSSFETRDFAPLSHHRARSSGKITGMKNPNLTPSRVLAVVLAAALVIFVIARRRDDGALRPGERLSDSIGPDDLPR